VRQGGIGYGFVLRAGKMERDSAVTPSVNMSSELVSIPIPRELEALQVPPLRPGDYLDQPTFHARYEAMPPGFRAELVEGVVIVPSPITEDHSDPSTLSILWLGNFSLATPGTKANDNVSVILSPASELQPDAMLRIKPSHGGRTRRVGKYIAGPPELALEVAFSSEAYDLHSKRRDFERAGVLEYVVVLLRERQVVWFVLRDGRFETMPPDSDGIYRSTVFPGLWLDPAALLENDGEKVMETLRRGLADPRHAEFVRVLEQAVK
jgi:hypothetical protein